MGRAAAKPAGDTGEQTPAGDPAAQAPAEQAPAEQAPAEQAPAEQAPAPAPEPEAAAEPATLDVVMLVSLSGLRDGVAWPAAGEAIALPVDEAEGYIANGYAKPAE
jgi:cell division septation protein DedD